MSLITTTITLVFLTALTFGLTKALSGKIMAPYLSSTPLMTVPSGLKCLFNESDCEYNDLSIQTIIISLFFMLGGYHTPDSYFSALCVSIGSQALRYWIDGQSSFVIDPMANMTAYAIGSCCRAITSHMRRYMR